MLLRKHPLVALGLLLILTGLLNVSAQTQQTQQKKKKDKEILTTGPRPFVQLSEHAAIITPCGDTLADARMPLTATVTNFSTTPLRYSWRVSGGQLNGEGPNATWDLSNVAPGTYTARVEVDNNRDDGCVAFTSTKVVVRPCPPPPVLCPSISISGPDTVAVGAPVTFTASVNGGTPGISPVYNWTVTAGTITSGQGTPSITVDTSGLAGQSINAALAVEGYSLNCAATYTVQIPRKITSILVDNYPPLPRDDEKARLDNFAIQLQNDPSAKGYVIVYGGPRVNAAEKQKRIKRAIDYLVLTRGIDAARIVTVDGGSRDQTTTELWIVPLGADPPGR
ncbi:MAG TPA: hypothetical protein VGN95_20095 [Pyrinomonadaceae bacterium]|jgi:hypothetical protein|nr:hypothetical protein [Pyrinomonadaceae bacterium]